MSVGNDVVDLSDPETELRGLHPRFAERVFTRAERDALAAGPARCAAASPGSDAALHWAFWAAKESAYKARKRLAPQTLFSPKEFEVELAPLPAAEAAGVVAGWVLYRGQRFALEVRLDGTSVHAVARSADAANERLLWQVETASGDPSLAARRLAIGTIGSALGLDRTALRIDRRPPVATYQGRQLTAALSLSHHGRLVAVACSLPRPH